MHILLILGVYAAKGLQYILFIVSVCASVTLLAAIITESGDGPDMYIYIVHYKTSKISELVSWGDF